MKKIIVIGCPGSGKSHFAKALHRLTGIPLYHLDMLFWQKDKTAVEKDIFLERLLNILELEEWIIDGNYASTMELRLQAADTVFFLDYPTDICLDGVRARKGRPRSDLPWQEGEQEDRDFMDFIKNYRSQSRPRVMELLKSCPQKDIHIFSSRAQGDRFLAALKKP